MPGAAWLWLARAGIWIEKTTMSPHSDSKTGVPRAGIDIIRDFAKPLPNAPGVYRMMNAAGDVLYVGKARSLKKRVTTYIQPAKLPIRIQRMVHETRAMEFVRTRSEVEALLLESNLIKRLKPRYNVSLRDDKSFPYIELTSSHAFPRLAKHRGSRSDGPH